MNKEKAAGLTDEEIKECVEYDEQLEDVLTKAYETPMIGWELQTS